MKDLIPNREFLITQEYWKRQNKLAADPEGLTSRPGTKLNRTGTASRKTVIAMLDLTSR